MYIFVFLGEKVRINGQIVTKCLLWIDVLFREKKLCLLLTAYYEPSLTFIIDMRDILAENSTELISKQRSVSDVCKCYALSTKIAIIYKLIRSLSIAKFNTGVTWCKGNFRQKSRAPCIILRAETVRFGATNGLFLWMWICSSSSQTQLHKINWQSRV